MNPIQQAIEAIEAMMHGSSKMGDGSRWGSIRMPSDDAMNKAESALTSLRSLNKEVEGVAVEHIRAAGGIVHSDGNIFFTNIDQLRTAVAAALGRGDDWPAELSGDRTERARFGVVVDSVAGLWIDDDDFIFDASIKVDGDFPDDATKRKYLDEIVRRLNGRAPATYQAGRGGQGVVDSEFIHELLWGEYPECCGNPVVGAEYMGQEEMVCCGCPEPSQLSDAQIVAALRERFPEAAAPSPDATQPTQAEALSEREAFRLWKLAQPDDVISEWSAWQARAALATQQAEPVNARLLEGAYRDGFGDAATFKSADTAWAYSVTAAKIEEAFATQQAVPTLASALAEAKAVVPVASPPRDGGDGEYALTFYFRTWDALTAANVAWTQRGATQQAVQGEPVALSENPITARAQVVSMRIKARDKDPYRPGNDVPATPPAPGQVERDREDADYLCKLVDAIGKDVLGVLKQYGDAQAAIGLMASRTKEAIRAARSSEGGGNEHSR
jgi:hypothetical protein